MRTIRPLILLAALLAIAGAAAAQNDPCPDCDDDGAGNENNSYHSVDVGATVENETGTTTKEVLADTDSAHSHDDDENGLWLWMAICLSAFLQHVEDVLGIHTDIDVNAEVYAESNGVDVDASLTGAQPACDAIGAQTACAFDFDDSEAGDADGMTWQAIAAAEAATGQDVWAPAVIPDTGDSDTDVCLQAEFIAC